MLSTQKPTVAIVGRPNVGKSTLFNRLVGRRDAIESETAGTTRDRVIGETEWAGKSFVLVDTGGIDRFPETDLWQGVRRQIDIALDDADVIVMVADAEAGLTAPDRDAADSLRAVGKPIVLAVNKADNPHRETLALEFYELGLGEPIPLSAYHNIGVDDLMARVADITPEPSFHPDVEADLRLAIVGRTNVGKSMLLNAITGGYRAIVSEVPGTTRDSLDELIEFEGRSVQLIDTAGMRRRGRTEPGIERYSVLRSMRAIDRADVAVLVLDASELATNQDTHVASYVLDAYKGIVIAVNKWDLARELSMDRETATQELRHRFRFASFAPVCFTSGLRREGIEELLHTAWEVFEECGKSLPRYELRRQVLNAVADHPPASSGRRALKIYGVTQDNTLPPSFTFYVNSSSLAHFSYTRYLENRLRQAFVFKGSPLRMRFKGRGEQ